MIDVRLITILIARTLRFARFTYDQATTFQPAVRPAFADRVPLPDSVTFLNHDATWLVAYVCVFLVAHSIKFNLQLDFQLFFVTSGAEALVSRAM